MWPSLPPSLPPWVYVFFCRVRRTRIDFRRVWRLRDPPPVIHKNGFFRQKTVYLSIRSTRRWHRDKDAVFFSHRQKRSGARPLSFFFLSAINCLLRVLLLEDLCTFFSLFCTFRGTAFCLDGGGLGALWWNASHGSKDCELAGRDDYRIPPRPEIS